MISKEARSVSVTEGTLINTNYPIQHRQTRFAGTCSAEPHKIEGVECGMRIHQRPFTPAGCPYGQSVSPRSARTWLLRRLWRPFRLRQGFDGRERDYHRRKVGALQEPAF